MTLPIHVSAAGVEPVVPYPVSAESLPQVTRSTGRYTMRFAQTREDLDRILRLRFRVFNLELGEGLAESHLTGRDEDDLDRRFHHLLIEDRRTGDVVGTYRMQTPAMASHHGGFYTAAEFDLSTFPGPLLDRSVEIGRACVVRDHRNGRVLHLLWRGLADYLIRNGKTALFGCCSLTSQDPALGIATFRHLEAAGAVHRHVRISPLPAAACAVEPGATLPAPHVPALFQSYLDLGARVCGPPAIDRAFQTIDFLVLLDTRELAPRVYRSFFG